MTVTSQQLGTICRTTLPFAWPPLHRPCLLAGMPTSSWCSAGSLQECGTPSTWLASSRYERHKGQGACWAQRAGRLLGTKGRALAGHKGQGACWAQRAECIIGTEGKALTGTKGRVFPGQTGQGNVRHDRQGVGVGEGGGGKTQAESTYIRLSARSASPLNVWTHRPFSCNLQNKCRQHLHQQLNQMEWCLQLFQGCGLVYT